MPAIKPPITEVPQNTHTLLQQAQGDPALAANIAAANEQRWGTMEDVATLKGLLPHLPQLPESEAFEVYDRVREAEARLVAPNMRAADYWAGTATVDNELAYEGSGRLFISVEHGSEPVRKNGSGADHGTAGLAAVLGDFGAESVITIGRQTSNAVSDPEHPIKHAIKRLLVPGRVGFLSLHGMAPNKVTDLLDETEVHAFVGLGAPALRATTLDAVERSIAKVRDELGLRVAIGNRTDFLLFKKNPDWNGVDFRDMTDKLKYGGELPATNRLEAAVPNTTVNYVLNQTEGDAELSRLATYQIELSRSLRLTPDDLYRRDRTRAAMGVYMGYRLLETFVRNTYAASEMVH